MKETIASNLIRYRKEMRLSQEKLATIVGLTRQSINNYEKAKTLPDSKILSALAKALEVTLDDLLRTEESGLPNFRFRASASFHKKPQFATQIFRELKTYNSLEQAVGLPTYAPESTPCYQLIGNEKRISAIANQFRHRLGLGDASIFNLFKATEEIGLKVLRYPIPIKEFFGLSACSFNQGAFVLVNNHQITIEQQLFTLANEIGHLIFHRDEYQDSLVQKVTKDKNQAREDVANYFAGHLLVPDAQLERMYQLTTSIIKLKQHFRVSYQVILSRLAQIGFIDYAKEKAKIDAIYKRQHGSSLKNSMELLPNLTLEEFPENERYYSLVWQALALDKISEMKAAEILNLTIEELRIRRQEAEVYAIA